MIKNICNKSRIFNILKLNPIYRGGEKLVIYSPAQALFTEEYIMNPLASIIKLDILNNFRHFWPLIPSPLQHDSTFKCFYRPYRPSRSGVKHLKVKTCCGGWEKGGQKCLKLVKISKLLIEVNGLMIYSANGPWYSKHWVSGILNFENSKA